MPRSNPEQVCYGKARLYFTVLFELATARWETPEVVWQRQLLAVARRMLPDRKSPSSQAERPDAALDGSIAR